MLIFVHEKPVDKHEKPVDIHGVIVYNIVKSRGSTPWAEGR
jgi:hypothetical protein